MQRIQSFDLARGFTVLLMPSIHVVMLYSKPEIQNSLLGQILGFIAEGPGAQLFMLLMGVSFVYSSRVNKKYVLQRSTTLFAAAYILNFLKFIIPLGLGLMPDELLKELHLTKDSNSLTFFLLIGDILQFAAIAYLILYFVTRSKHFPYIATILAITVMMISPLVWDIKTGISLIDHVIVLFNGHPPFSFFPVFPWLVYPLIGLTLGHLLKNGDINYILRKTGFAGFALFIISIALPATEPSLEWLPFYRTEPADTLFHLGIVLVWLQIFNWIRRKVPANPFFRLLTFCSKNITPIYIIQWVIICWCLYFTGYLQLDMLKTFYWMTGITAFTLLLTYGIKRFDVYSKSI